jgi:hypothetical protein
VRPLTAALNLAAAGDSRPNDFVALARSLARHQSWSAVADNAEADRLPTRVVTAVKAAVAAGTTATDPGGWLGNAIGGEGIVTDFIGSLMSASAFDAMFAFMARVPMRTRAAAVTIGAVGAAVGEGGMKPIAKSEFAELRLEPLKASVIIALTEEAVRAVGPAAMAFIGGELRRSLAVATDAVFVTQLLDDAATLASSGDDIADVRTDLLSLMSAIDLGATSRLFLLMAQDAWKRFMLLDLGNSRLGSALTPIFSDAVPAGTAALVDADGVAADIGPMAIDRSRHGALQLNDDPQAGPQTMTSLWQTNSVAIRVERTFAFAKIRDNAVAVLTDIEWGGVVSLPSGA